MERKRAIFRKTVNMPGMLIWMPRGKISRWLVWLTSGSASSAWVYVSVNLRSPYLLPVRETGFWLWMAMGMVATVLLTFQRKRITRNFHPLHLAAFGFFSGAIISGHERWTHYQNQQWAMKTSVSRMPEIGNHLLVGWLGFEETRALAAKGAIAGVFLTRRDFPRGSGIAEIRKTVDALQTARREAGLPPMWIATDQEGGLVSKLSPPLPEQPSLGNLLADLDGPDLASQPSRAAEIVRRVTAYAEIQAQALTEAGINLNFAPVVDLRPATPPDSSDRQSRIYYRALASDPATVALAGETYVTVLFKYGITAVLKHFPGLGRLTADTHHFSASMDVSAADLEESDWLPFRKISEHTKVGIMLGHVRLTSIDPIHPASGSLATVKLLREKWGAKGLLVTDDFSMTPISHGPGGVVRAAENSMAAGVDLILLSYDPVTVYDLLGEKLRH
jgi:beta-N-acetylhexosaminidase